MPRCGPLQISGGGVPVQHCRAWEPLPGVLGYPGAAVVAPTVAVSDDCACIPPSVPLLRRCPGQSAHTRSLAASCSAGCSRPRQAASLPTLPPQVSFRDVNLTLFPSPICSPDVVAGRIRQLQLFTGLDNSSVWGEGLIGHFHNFRQGGGQEGRARAGEVQA